MAAPDIGPEFAGYRMEGLIGRGALGEVYVGVHPRLHVEHALKVLFPELTDDAEFRERVLRQARETARLSHPNIAPLFDFGEESGRLYVVMPRVKGPSLRQLLDRDRRLSPALTLDLLRQAASGLDAAHAAGTVHGAMKPENVLAQPRGSHGPRVYLVDFGMTRRSGSDPLSRLQEAMSTVRYMAPEQINGTDVDGRADVYSLGCMLYECLTGHSPFDRDTEGAVLYAHLVEHPPRVTEARPELPEDIDEVVSRAMDKDRARRYATCLDLIHEAIEAAAPYAFQPHGRVAAGLDAHLPTPPAPPLPGIGGIPLPPPVPAPTPRFPGPGRRWRPLVWAAAAALLWGAIIAGALQLSGETGHRYPASAIHQFIAGCASQASRSVCGCEITGIERRFTLQEFRSLLARFSRSGHLPNELVAIARDCGDVRARGPAT